MATYTAAGGPLFLPADMGLLERQHENFDYVAWEVANGFFTKDTAATKVQLAMDQHKPDININSSATEWYTEISTQAGSSEIVVSRKNYGANGSNTRNVKLTFKGNFNVVSGVVLNGTVTEIIEVHEAIGRNNRTFTSSLKDIRTDYTQLLDYYGKAGGNLAALTLNGNDTILTDTSGHATALFQLRGFDGNDSITGSERGDVIHGDGGDDAITGKNGNDYLFGNSGNDKIDGNLGADVISGGEGNDQLHGGQGADVITGGLGKDTLNGGLDNDQLTGGGEADLFVLSKGQDTITDFNAKDGDKIQINKGQFFSLKQESLGLMIERNEGNTLLLGVLLGNFDAKTSIIEA